MHGVSVLLSLPFLPSCNVVHALHLHYTQRTHSTKRYIDSFCYSSHRVGSILLRCQCDSISYQFVLILQVALFLRAPPSKRTCFISLSHFSTLIFRSLYFHLAFGFSVLTLAHTHRQHIQYVCVLHILNYCWHTKLCELRTLLVLEFQIKVQNEKKKMCSLVATAVVYLY